MVKIRSKRGLRFEQLRAVHTKPHMLRPFELSVYLCYIVPSSYISGVYGTGSPGTGTLHMF